ncbi:MAG: DUF5777 family beta-barrel protein [Crocinitomicaceae bacterium]
MKNLGLIAVLFSIGQFGYAQDVTGTFNSTRIVNSHSTEMLGKKMWEYRIEHRFGDVAGSNGGAQTAFGFDNAADIRMAMEYGISDKIMAGLGRSKGIGRPYTSLVDGFIAARILTQNKENGMPISAALVGTMYYTYMKQISDPQSVANFEGKFSRRIAYSSQLVLSRKFSDRISFALMPTYVHRNYVAQDDLNDLVSLGAALNVKINKSMGVILEYFYNFENENFRTTATNSIGLGFEFVTNGHNFHINFTNARGFGELQYVALTQEDWLKGQFRLGFSISRNFKIKKS